MPKALICFFLLLFLLLYKLSRVIGYLEQPEGIIRPFVFSELFGYRETRMHEIQTVLEFGTGYKTTCLFHNQFILYTYDNSI